MFRVDGFLGCSWTAVAWWKRKKGARKFLRTKANPAVKFRIMKES